jgi:hypothetical protein
MVKWVIAALLGVHGLIHLMGFAKAFGLAELPQLTDPISRGWGLAWLAAALLVLATAVLFTTGVRSYWLVGAVGVVVSQAVIFTAWRDAWAGTILNAILLGIVVYGWATEGPTSFRAQFLRDGRRGSARSESGRPLAEADLAGLPDPVRRYLCATRAIGQPRGRSYHLRFSGRIRSDPGSRWMPFRAEQVSFTDPPARFFLMRAHMSGIPVEAFHRFVDGHATMKVKALGLVSIVDARGDVMDRSETVTVFNDMCLLAPATLVDPRIQWEEVDSHSVGAKFTIGAHTIGATLCFDSEGLLTNFISDDRSRSSPDGRTFTRLRFSTPTRDYRRYGGIRIASHGDARWHLPDGEFTYGEFEIIDVAYS